MVSLESYLSRSYTCSQDSFCCTATVISLRASVASAIHLEADGFLLDSNPSPRWSQISHSVSTLSLLNYCLAYSSILDSSTASWFAPTVTEYLALHPTERWMWSWFHRLFPSVLWSHWFLTAEGLCSKTKVKFYSDARRSPTPPLAPLMALVECWR